MANILYLSCHAILEWDEVTLLTELGHNVFSDGAYSDPTGNKLLPRPAIPEGKYFPELEQLARENPKTRLADETIEWADIIIIMHTPEWVTENWDRIKHKKVVWRSIGQSTKHVENMIRKPRYEGLNVIRYSPVEQNLPDYVGADAVIRFYKDPDEFKDWNGNTKRVINMSQSLKARSTHCHYNDIMAIVEGFPALIYGSGNDNLGPLNGGELPYDLMKGAMRDSRAFVYGGTWPAAYTLAFIEAWMTGIPIVSIGQKLAEDINEIPQVDRLKFFEVTNLIQNGVNGFIADDYGQARAYLHELLEDQELAKRIGDAGRVMAIELFGKETIKAQWKEFLDSL